MTERPAVDTSLPTLQALVITLIYAILGDVGPLPRWPELEQAH